MRRHATQNSNQQRQSAYRDQILSLCTWLMALAVVSIVVWIIGDILWHGLGQLSWMFLTAAPEDVGRAGGIGPIVISTLLLLGVCLSVSLPLGLSTAILLAEFIEPNHWFGRLVRRSLDMLAGVPSIVFGLFGNAFFSVLLGMGFSILSGGLTLACMILPILIRSIEDGLCAVPNEYRLGAASLGISRTSILMQLLLPAAMPSLVAGLILGIGRAIAETAALIYTSGYVDRMPVSLLSSGRALSLHIFDLSMNVPGGDRNAYTAATVLVILILVINGTATWIGNRWRSHSIYL
ncbi:phosphate ABC transporter permease PstA [Leptolyngbya cf. ectocarpi LEGE 11479]|uniref:Phosphate transport system permease protein PstA n=1 Tax=Leptolyngbya cf. ectocarpi LEGE 11479 TaxID=1828722 RepID=A0A929A065_LEPEC|nr:phosphate ABC transporter permease PstA [Leptolyngbya ectocarpi]MBE9070647.1 phosphate ABC transporter permease PstA [Leptolyngbya cf. ectocarpi LEGE 11479]